MLRYPGLEKEQTLRQLYARWADIVAVFTMRSLSVDGDCLPALSGLVKQFAFVLGEKGAKQTGYLAGLWEGNLVKG